VLVLYLPERAHQCRWQLEGRPVRGVLLGGHSRLKGLGYTYQLLYSRSTRPQLLALRASLVLRCEGRFCQLTLQLAFVCSAILHFRLLDQSKGSFRHPGVIQELNNLDFFRAFEIKRGGVKTRQENLCVLIRAVVERPA
jgi:hypothetical protein